MALSPQHTKVLVYSTACYQYVRYIGDSLSILLPCGQKEEKYFWKKEIGGGAKNWL